MTSKSPLVAQKLQDHLQIRILQIRMLESDSSSEDSEEMRQKEEQIIKKRAVHARYMRFSRSLTSYLAKQIESIGLLAGTLQ